MDLSPSPVMAYPNQVRDRLRLMFGWLSALSSADSAETQHGFASAGNFETARRTMIAEQLSGSERALANPQVLEAIRRVPRHEFVPRSVRPDAYRDRPLPIGYGQTISQPYIVALMTEYLEPKQTDRILEIGTGSGYQAAVLSQLVEQVYTIEIIEALAKRASSDLERMGYRNISVRKGDGSSGWPEAAPFDAIIVTCAPKAIPPQLIDQLRENGRLVIPVGNESAQELIVLRKSNDQLKQRNVLSVRFVPMTGQGNSRTV